jgi:hypothetical protein
MSDAQIMQAVMSGLTKIFPGCAIALVVAPFDAPVGGRANWISNGKREEMLVLLKEVVARFEGRAHDAPEAKQ